MEFNEYYFVFLRRNTGFQFTDDQDQKELGRGHFHFQQKQKLDGTLLVAGPLDGAGGIYLFKSDDQTKDSLLELLNEDPYVRIGLFSPEVHKWYVPPFFLSIPETSETTIREFYSQLIG